MPQNTTTFLGDDDVEEEGLSSSESVGENTNPNEVLIKTGVQFFTQLAQTLKNSEENKALIEHLIYRDETGKIFLKIPIENESVVVEALQGLSTIFGAFLKP